MITKVNNKNKKKIIILQLYRKRIKNRNSKKMSVLWVRLVKHVSTAASQFRLWRGWEKEERK